MIQNLKNEVASESSETAGEARDCNELDLEARLQYTRRFGDSTIAYSTACQPGLKFSQFDDGFIAYASKWGFDYALGDPLVANDKVNEAVGEFISRCKRKPCFVNFSAKTAEALSGRGYYINQMGVDTWLPLDKYDFKGKSKESFRYAANWLARRDYRIEEKTFAEISVEAVKEISKRWRDTRTVKDREVGFLNRPLILEDEADVRKFFLFDKDDNIVAFVFLDPVYENGEITGYSTVIKRRDPSAPNYAEPGITKHCVDVLKSEGRKTLRLGLSPLAYMTDRTYKRNPLLHFGWSCGFNAWWVNKYFYNLKGHAAFKRRFKGTEHPVYFATPALISDLRVTAMLKIMGVF